MTEKLSILDRSRLFENLMPEELEMLAELSQYKRYEAGEVIFEEGDVGNSLYVIDEGVVEVLRRARDGGQICIAVLKDPEFFGEMSLIDKEYRSASVRARTDATLLHLSSENLHSFAKVFKTGFTLVVINIARVLSSRLRDTNRRLAEYLHSQG